MSFSERETQITISLLCTHSLRNNEKTCNYQLTSAFSEHRNTPLPFLYDNLFEQ